MTQAFTRADVDALSKKVEEFAHALPENERAVLGRILSRADDAQEPEVAGFNFGAAWMPATSDPTLPPGVDTSGTPNIPVHKPLI